MLARARADGTREYSDFLATWRNSQAELVFTRTHLVELRQHNDPEAREQRYLLLADLLPIRSDIVTREPVPERPVLIQAREVLRALSSKKAFELRSDDAQALTEWRRQHIDVLPGRWTEPADVRAARSFEDESFGKIVLFMQHAMRTEASAQTRPADVPYSRPKVRDLPDAPVDEAQTKVALETLDAVYASDAEVSALFPFIPLAVARDLIRRQMEPLRAMILRAGEVGIRQAYLEAMGLVFDPTDKRHLDDVSNELLFRHHVRDALELLQVAQAQVDAFSERVTVADCPGFWLARAVHLEIRRAEPEPEASNSYDLDHVLYAPYVDAFFTDKRIAGYINAVRKRPTTIPAVAAMRAPLSTPASVEGIARAIKSAIPAN